MCILAVCCLLLPGCRQLRSGQGPKIFPSDSSLPNRLGTGLQFSFLWPGCDCLKIWKRWVHFSSKTPLIQKCSVSISKRSIWSCYSVNTQPSQIPAAHLDEGRGKEFHSPPTGQRGQGSKSPWSWKQISSFACTDLALLKVASLHSCVPSRAPPR